MRTADNFNNLRREEARKVIEDYEALINDPLRMATISEPLESKALFKIRCRALRKQYGIPRTTPPRQKRNRP